MEKPCFINTAMDACVVLQWLNLQQTSVAVLTCCWALISVTHTPSPIHLSPSWCGQAMFVHVASSSLISRGTHGTDSTVTMEHMQDQVVHGNFMIQYVHTWHG